MILTCPSCEASFHVTTEAFGKTPRKVRCNRCQYIWTSLPAKRPLLTRMFASAESDSTDQALAAELVEVDKGRTLSPLFLLAVIIVIALIIYPGLLQGDWWDWVINPLFGLWADMVVLVTDIWF